MDRAICPHILVITIALAGCGGLASAPDSSFTQPPTAAPTPTPAPTKPLTEIGQIDAEMWASYGPVDPDCGTCIPTEGNCSEYQGIERITYPEWEVLFPKAHFYLVATRVIENAESNMYGARRNNLVIAQQGGDRYTIDSFAQLLDANDVVITEDNLDQVARAFALMALANHLKGEVTFTSLQPGEWPDSRYQYNFTAWTEIQGYRVEFILGSVENHTLIAWGTRDSEVGEYIEEQIAFPPEGRQYIVQSN